MGDNVAVSAADQPDMTPEAKQAWLSVVVQAPNGWRSRATSAAGLLSTAAAATIVGLLLEAPVDRTPIELAATIVAGLGFFAAVLLLLRAGVHPSPTDGPSSEANRSQALKWGYTTLGFAELVEVYCRRDSRPVRNLTIAGSWVGALAVLLTVLTGVLISLSPSYDARLDIVDENVKVAFVRLCPAAEFPLGVRVDNVTAEFTYVTIPGDSCNGAESSRMSLPSSSLAIARMISK